MKKAVFHSIMALVMVLGLTIAMAVPVAGAVPEFPVTEKVVLWEDTDGHPEGVYLEHQNVEYLLKVTNDTGDSLEVQWIRDVFAYGTAAEEDSVWDNVLGDWVDHDPEDLPTAFSIPSGGYWREEVTHQIPSKEVVGDTVENRILVLGEAVEEYTGNIPAEVNVIRPAIQLTKTVTPSVAQAGQIVTYTFTITNTGDWPLDNITIEDDKLPDPDLQAKIPPGLVLAESGEEGDSYTFTYNYPIQAGDLPELQNTATVWGTAAGFDASVFPYSEDPGPEDPPSAVVRHAASATVTAPVGGTASPVSRLALLAPWIVLAGLIAGAAVFVWSRRAQSRA